MLISWFNHLQDGGVQWCRGPHTAGYQQHCAPSRALQFNLHSLAPPGHADGEDQLLVNAGWLTGWALERMLMLPISWPAIHMLSQLGTNLERCKQRSVLAMPANADVEN